MAELFGFSITRSKEKASASQNFTLPSIDDGAQTVVGGGIMGHYLDMEGKVRDEADLEKWQCSQSVIWLWKMLSMKQ